MSYLLEVEQHLIALLLAEGGSIWADVNLLVDRDFSPTYQQVMGVLRQQLDQSPPASTTPVVIAEKLKSYAVTEINGFDTLVVLNGLYQRSRLVDKKDARALMIELKTATAKRDLITACEVAKGKIKGATKLSEMVEAVTSTLTGVNTEYFKSGETEDLFAGMVEMIEDRGNQEKEDLGYVGVLPSIDNTIGPLIHKGSFANISARSGCGKSAFGFFYAVSTIEKYPETRLLWLDAGEMTRQQLQFRAACCFSRGRVPLWAIRSGEWRKKKEWVDILRGEVFPRVNKLLGRCEFRSVSGLSAKEKTNLMRRHYFNKVGREHFLVIVDDYLKGMESLNKETKEYQAIGYYTSDTKSLVTDEINGGFMTFTQSNRFGQVKGKKAEELQDNDSQVSLSDRIKDNCTTNWILRPKIMEELAAQKNAFGNRALINLKVRDGLGHDFERFLHPNKVGNGYVDNYFHLNHHGFHFDDMGMHADVLVKLGHGYVDLVTDRDEKKMP